MIDGYGGNSELLNNKDLVLKSLKELPDILGMHILYGPEIIFAQNNDHKDPGGWSGFVIIAESHISIHTFPLRGFISIDAYTCQNGLDTSVIIEYFQKTFALKDLETNFVKRGTRYPQTNLN